MKSLRWNSAMVEFFVWETSDVKVPADGALSRQGTISPSCDTPCSKESISLKYLNRCSSVHVVDTVFFTYFLPSRVKKHCSLHLGGAKYLVRFKWCGKNFTNIVRNHSFYGDSPHECSFLKRWVVFFWINRQIKMCFDAWRCRVTPV